MIERSLYDNISRLLNKIIVRLNLTKRNSDMYSGVKQISRIYIKFTDQELKNRIVENYRDVSTYGNGSTADALRYEKMTWILVGWKNHLEKSDREYRTLRKIVESWNLSGSDKNISQQQ
jgi:hypothetical protein